MFLCMIEIPYNRKKRSKFIYTVRKAASLLLTSRPKSRGRELRPGISANRFREMKKCVHNQVIVLQRLMLN